MELKPEDILESIVDELVTGDLAEEHPDVRLIRLGYGSVNVSYGESGSFTLTISESPLPIPAADDLPDSWATRGLALQALYDMANDFDRAGDQWENRTIPEYLEAARLLLESIQNAYANWGVPVPNDPWKVMSDCLRGARFYE